MARALGMNPRKLPRLRPSRPQRWKLPVGEFIEESYRKRFGGGPSDQHERGGEPRSQQSSSGDRDGARDWRSDLFSSVDSTAAPATAPRVVGARPAGAAFDDEDIPF